MDIEQISIIITGAVGLLTFAALYFRKAVYTWMLLAGIVGIPVIVVRQSHLMLSEIFLAPLIFLWFLKKVFGLGYIKLSDLPGSKSNIENSIWAMIAAFSMSTGFNIAFSNPSVAGEHVFIMGKLMALFLYIASVMTALLIADFIRSIEDVDRICFILISLGTVTFIIQLPGVNNLLGIIQRDAGWIWMSVTILFSFSLAYVLFHPMRSKRLQNSYIALIIGVQIFSCYFLRTATYKTILIASYILVLTIVYYKSKTMSIMIICLTIMLFVVTLGIFSYYVEQETQEGSWGESKGSRFAVWQHSLSIFLERPIFGVGPYNYYDCSLYMAGKKNGNDENKGVMTSPHGQYVQVLVETGILGALAFFWFMVELFKLLKYFVTRQDNYRINIIASAIAAILVSRLAAGMVGDYVIPQYHNGGLQTFCSTVYFWLCVGVLVGLKRVLMLKDQQKEY